MAQVNEVVVAMISTGLPQDKKMVDNAWEYEYPGSNEIPESPVNDFAKCVCEIFTNAAAKPPGLLSSTCENYIYFQDRIIELLGIESDDEIQKVRDFIGPLLVKIPDGPITSGSMLYGEDLKNLLSPDGSISVSERLLDWLALYTGSTRRLHLTSLCSYDVGTNKFPFPIMPVTSSLSLPFKINRLKIQALGIYTFSPISMPVTSRLSTKTEKEPKTHEVHLNFGA